MSSSQSHSRLKCVFADIDGVLTKLDKTYDLSGNVISKTFCDKDFTAIKLFKERGIETVLVSADDRVNKALAVSKGIEFFHSRFDSKYAIVNRVLKEKKIELHEVIYVGDDMPDLDCFESLPFTFCPSDAIHSIREKAYAVLQRGGGGGCLMEIFEMFSRGELFK